MDALYQDGQKLGRNLRKMISKCPGQARKGGQLSHKKNAAESRSALPSHSPQRDCDGEGGEHCTEFFGGVD